MCEQTACSVVEMFMCERVRPHRCTRKRPGHKFMYIYNCVSLKTRAHRTTTRQERVVISLAACARARLALQFSL